ncbi:MAG TPA: hypothetical protein VFK31_11410 [Rhodanobacteraceae bacterium]|nr:hypothetical protein [Rhodanobacteraceae bacterium]
MMSPPSRPDERWQRPYWHASGENAMLLFFVFGDFGGDRQPLAELLALPSDIKLKRYAHAALKSWDGYPLAGSLGEVFEDEAPQTLVTAREAPEVLRMAGTVNDPSDLHYLRDTLNAITRLLDAGGAAAVDPQAAGLFDRRAWRQRFLGGAGDSLRQHVLVLCDDDSEDARFRWIHTRGMRKFARRDLSLVRVPAAEVNRAGALCQQLVDMLALGGLFAEGQQLPVDGLPGPLTAHLAGDADDPRFYNTHVELRWPG